MTEPGPSYQVQQPQQQVPINYQVQKMDSEPSKAGGGMENLVVMKNPGLSSLQASALLPVPDRHSCH